MGPTQPLTHTLMAIRPVAAALLMGALYMEQTSAAAAGQRGLSMDQTKYVVTAQTLTDPLWTQPVLLADGSSLLPGMIRLRCFGIARRSGDVATLNVVTGDCQLASNRFLTTIPKPLMTFPWHPVPAGPLCICPPPAAESIFADGFET